MFTLDDQINSIRLTILGKVIHSFTGNIRNYSSNRFLVICFYFSGLSVLKFILDSNLKFFFILFIPTICLRNFLNIFCVLINRTCIVDVKYYTFQRFQTLFRCCSFFKIDNTIMKINACFCVNGSCTHCYADKVLRHFTACSNAVTVYIFCFGSIEINTCWKNLRTGYYSFDLIIAISLDFDRILFGAANNRNCLSVTGTFYGNCDRVIITATTVVQFKIKLKLNGVFADLNRFTSHFKLGDNDLCFFGIYRILSKQIIYQ